MKKVMLIILLILTISRAEPIVVKDKEVKVGDRVFAYYCLDGKLWLETFISGSRTSTVKFVQVYRPHSSSIPMECSYNPDSGIRYEGQVSR